jgi:PAS domain S-box-containing protein
LDTITCGVYWTIYEGLKVMNFNITTKIYFGFGAVLLLLIGVSYFGTSSLNSSSDTFVKYRTMARQTNADGRIQANMLMTRIFAKNFVISASSDNIDGVKERAQRTLEMIDEADLLTKHDSTRKLLVGDLKRDLNRYVEEFEKVTEWQAQRNELVVNRLNVLGPETERKLTEIMNSALSDGDTIAAYQAGVTLRNLLLGRLYANRFLIENDDASVDRAMSEFRQMGLSAEKLLSELENPERRELAEAVKVLQTEYMVAFTKVRRVIDSRNILIKYELDRIGPEVATFIERLKLSIKEEQDKLGPAAQAEITKAVSITTTIAIIAIIAGFVIAGAIGRAVSRPIRLLTTAAEAMAAGELNQVVDTDRNDEFGTLAKAFVAMRGAIDDKVNNLKLEIEERERAEGALSVAQSKLKKANEELEEKVALRTEELAEKEEQLRVALSNMTDGIFTLDSDLNFRMFNERYIELSGFPKELYVKGKSIDGILNHAAEAGYYGPGDTEQLVNKRRLELRSDDYVELETVTPEGRILVGHKSPLKDGGALVVFSDVTERVAAERKLQDAFHNISSSIKYASKIQKSILPSAQSLDAQFSDHFVYWEPRDVVGGDIYWSYRWGEGVLLILGDCTGHGVPGAFMTLISTGALDRAMADVPVGDVSQLVQRMHQNMRESLGQEDGNGGADDGLELGACFIAPGQSELKFVGARFDLFVVENNDVRLIRGGKKGIGYHEVTDKHSFDECIVESSPTTRFYMATDGAVDQINDMKKQRFGKKRFKNLLLEVQNMPMSEQGDAIRDAIIGHQGSAPRLDDIAVVGFSVGV